MALAKVGLNAEKDVTLLQIGVQTARYAALQSKNVQATIITPPFTLTARKAGMNTLIDMAELNIPFQLTGMLALRPYLKSNPEMVLSVIRALSEGIHFYKREKETTHQDPRQVFENRRSRGARRDPPGNRHQIDAGKALSDPGRVSKPSSTKPPCAIRKQRARNLKISSTQALSKSR